MSETPRTDAEATKLTYQNDIGDEYDATPYKDKDGEWVSIELARTLETELTAVRLELEKAKSVRNDRERRRSKAEAENRELTWQLTAVRGELAEARKVIHSLEQTIDQMESATVEDM